MIPADLVVCAVGIRANAALAKSAGVARQSRHRRRRRLGDVASRRSTRSANAPSIAASATDWSSPATSRRTCSPRGSRATPMRPMPASVLATNLKVSGVSVFSAGDFSGGAGRARPRLHGRGGRALPAAADRATGGSPGPCCSAIRRMRLWYLDLIRTGADIRAHARPPDLRPRASRPPGKPHDHPEA